MELGRTRGTPGYLAEASWHVLAFFSSNGATAGAEVPNGVTRGAGGGDCLGAAVGGETDAWVPLAACPPVSALALLDEPEAAPDATSRATRKPMPKGHTRSGFCEVR
jgi:hypothetical protein